MTTEKTIGRQPDQTFTAQKTIDKNTTVGQLVAERPELAKLFETLGIDFCCGGKLGLADACRKKDLQVEDVLSEIIKIIHKEPEPNAKDWTKSSLKDLVDHIIKTYHQPLRAELPRVAQLAHKVAQKHGDNYPQMIEAQNIFDQFRFQLEMHMQKEEMILFPAIINMELGHGQFFGCGSGIQGPICVMTQEHDDAADALLRLRQLTNNYTPPADACNSFKVLLHTLAQIESEMHQHVHKENNILFPRAVDLIKTTA